MTNKNVLVVSSDAKTATELACELQECGLYAAARRSLLKEIPNYVRAIIVDNASGALDDTVENISSQSHLFVRVIVITDMEEPKIYEEDRILYISSKIDKKDACHIINFCVNPIYDLDRLIKDILFSLGLLSNLRGHRYIMDAVKIGLENPKSLYHVHREVYAVIARYHDYSQSAIERSIRHAIETAYLNDADNRFQTFFGRLNHKPTNAEFISCIVEKILTYYN